MSDTEYDNRNSPSYLAHYAMHRAPFSSKHEPDMFYSEPSRVQRLDILLHLTQYSTETLLVTGPEGIGKTTLLQQFLEKAHDSWRICPIDAHSRMDSEQLIQHIVRGFKFTLDNGPKPKLDKLSYQLELALASTQTVVITIDNAHVLSTQTLAVLAKLAKIKNNTSGANIRIILFCEPQIKIQFASAEMDKHKQSEFRKIDLPPFNEQQTRDLILHRTKLAGLNSDNTFTDTAIAKLHKQSEGIPGTIVELAHRVLFEMTPLKRRVKPKLDKNGRRRSGKKLIGLTLAIIIAILLLLVLLFQNKLNALYLSHLQKSQTQLQTIEPIPTPAVTPQDTPVDRDELQTSEILTPGSQVQVSDPLNTAQWLLAQNPSAYTLQILAGERKTTIDRFLSSHNLQTTKMAYFQSTSHGKIWHSLVYGLYPDYASASRAAAVLPDSVKEANPWIRQLSTIHIDIQQSNLP